MNMKVSTAYISRSPQGNPGLVDNNTPVALIVLVMVRTICFILIFYSTLGLFLEWLHKRVLEVNYKPVWFAYIPLGKEQKLHEMS